MITRFTVGAKDFLPLRIWGQNMRYDSNKHHRRSIRLKGFDYTREGAYFVTICTQNQACLFGEIVNGQMRLNDVGEVADICWRAIPERFPRVVLDAFVIMPNHVHGIIWIGPENRANVGAKNFSPLPPQPPRPSQRGASAFRSSIENGWFRAGFKIGVTKWCGPKIENGWFVLCVVSKSALPNGCGQTKISTPFGNAIIMNTSSGITPA